MSLRSAVRGFDNACIQVTTITPRLLRSAADRVERKAEGLEIPADLDEFDYEGAICNLQRGQANRKELRRLASGGLRSIEEHQDRDALLETLLAAVRATQRGLIRALLVGYLLLPDASSLTARTVRRFLLRHQEKLPKQWQGRIQAFHLLSDNVGQHCAQLILQSDLEFSQQFFDDSGLKGVKSSGGVAVQIFETLSAKVEQKHSLQVLARYTAFVKLNDEIRFSTNLSHYAQALLSPYLGEQPPDDIKALIEPFLLEHFGDPRMNPGRWASVPDELIGVMKRWLAKASIELLLKVVDESNDTTQWSERHKFWSHYFDLGLVTDAWVALGRNAAFVARQLVKQEVLHSASDYGVIDGGGVQADHSVLIFRIQDFVVTEWTHSGKVRIYDAANKRGPSFYQRNYSAEFLRHDGHANVRVIHHSNWRNKVADFMRYELGVTPPRGVRTGQDTRRCSSCGRTVHALWFDAETAKHCSRCKLKNIYE